MQVLDLECDVLVLGGGMGGCAAALAAARMGYWVCLTEENPWLGGQCTSQGVSALDEHRYIETFGGTASYTEFRRLIRAYYQDNYHLSPEARATVHLNPGAGWVSRLCFEPKAGLGALLHLLIPYAETGRLQLYYHARAIAAQVEGDRIVSVSANQPEYERLLRFHPTYVLDATELGDLLPLVGIPYLSGAESQAQTGEPHARQDGPAPQLVQSFTMPFVVDYRPGEDHTIAKPPDYEYNRDHQPYTLTLRYGTRDLTYKVFEPVAELPGAFWTYRRLLAHHLFAPGQFEGDLAMINWSGNDYKGGNLIDATPAEQARLIEAAKNLSLGLLYWLQTEVPRDDGQGQGYPGLRLRRDVLGTADGLSQYPYIRESRRIQARRTVREQDVSAEFQPGARAEFFVDSVGLGLYPIDIHGVPGDTAATGPTKPFQIPLGSLIPEQLTNLLPACKNLGVTHMTNGCYRLHPVERNIGESAGMLAAFCLASQQPPAAVFTTPTLLRDFQRELLQQGIPLYWYEDLPAGHPAWAAAQFLGLTGIWPGDPEHLRFEPETRATAEEIQRVCRRAGMEVPAEPLSRGELARRVAATRFGLPA
ncbi:MAG: FAD-dependent oxidoreductase [Candidatus Latescibacteria bacterium]|nr:FAD-dependent oxidoreductase [Candidatus Latescibacterota bacterium]